MTRVTDSTAAGGTYIWTTTADSGTAQYTVNVPVAGDYVVWGRVYCADTGGNDDSYYVKVDTGDEDVYDMAEGLWGPYWQWTVVNGRGGTGVPLTLNPRIFTLTAGSHTFQFRGREVNSRLDRLCFTNNLSYVPSDLVPTPWGSTDIGAVAAYGTTGYSSGTFTIEGSGADIGGTADEMIFVYRRLFGDGEITARVASIENTNSLAKAGVMIREDLTAGSKNGADLLTPVASNKARFQRRTSAGGSTSSSSSSGDVTAPYWLRLNRTGNTFKAYISTNGTSWTQFGSNRTITMATNVYIGLVVCSHNDGTLCTATFDNVSVTE
jgi:regulation of enolase protein 1 (concanavalin A-like superfamily)